VWSCLGAVVLGVSYAVQCPYRCSSSSSQWVTIWISIVLPLLRTVSTISTWNVDSPSEDFDCSSVEIQTIEGLWAASFVKVLSFVTLLVHLH
jgi:hypothetical protein